MDQDTEALTPYRVSSEITVSITMPEPELPLTDHGVAMGCLSTRYFHVKLLTTLPDPLVFGLIAALASLLWSVATATVNL
jgi:hypothetical protein